MNKHTELSSKILAVIEDIKKIQEDYNLQESETQEIIYQLSLIGFKYYNRFAKGVK
jgi:hypothetical protein|tara:strand:+ start:612 stop:779 length:168 start_codon:yes stop_codon:yes gene_type:complete